MSKGDCDWEIKILGFRALTDFVKLNWKALGSGKCSTHGIAARHQLVKSYTASYKLNAHAIFLPTFLDSHHRARSGQSVTGLYTVFLSRKRLRRVWTLACLIWCHHDGGGDPFSHVARASETPKWVEWTGDPRQSRWPMTNDHPRFHSPCGGWRGICWFFFLRLSI